MSEWQPDEEPFWISQRPRDAWQPSETAVVDYDEPEPPKVLLGPAGEVLLAIYPPPVGFAREIFPKKP